MGRWKAPPPASSPYITQAGFDSLKAEDKALWLKRREVVKALAAAAAEGDRSENAEYIYRKKELGGIDYRIRYLQKRIPKLTVVTDHPAAEKIFFGAWVTLEKDDDTEVEYRIVGPDETDAKTGFISMDSPLAKALLKKSIDDEVSLTLQGELTNYLIAGIRYS
jgi:transcription elongation factor GreB